MTGFDKTFLEGPEYDFLREDPRLGERVAYLALSGSYAYGTNREGSDIDVRGIAIESMDSLLVGNALEQVENRATDTVVYGLRKYLHLCAECNPNAIELLGTKEEHILYMNEVGKRIRENAGLFLSKRAYKTFVGYATAQLRRLQNALAHDSYPEVEKERHIMKSIESMMVGSRREYGLEGAEISFELLDSTQEDMEKEIHVSLRAERIPLRRFLSMNAGLSTMLRNYAKLNHRNRKKDAMHLQKHAMHLIRLYLTGIDILEGRGIHTYREQDLPLLRSIRAGEISMEEVFRMAEEYEAHIAEAYRRTRLPEEPDWGKIERLLVEIYRTYMR